MRVAPRRRASARAAVGVCLLALGLAACTEERSQPPAWDVTRPRGHTREIDFETTEGTWMSLDVSPDGRWLVFDLLAHIYRVPVAGGQAECLTKDSGIALNYHPRFSPDGQQIAFISDRAGQDNLWVMQADGAQPRAVHLEAGARISQPVWTPDGKFIVARRTELGEGFSPDKTAIWRFGADDGKGVPLVGPDPPQAGWPAVSPDGRYLYFHVTRWDDPWWGHADALGGAWQIRRQALAGGPVQELSAGQTGQQARTSSGGAYAPEPSPDGRWLAFARRIPDGTISFKGHRMGPRTALWLRDLASGEERVLMDPIELDLAEADAALRVLPGYAWSPDSESVFISQGGKLRRVHVETGRVDTIPFRARVHRTLSERAYAPFRIDDGPFEARFLRWPSASPDGQEIVFQGVGKLWRSRASGGEPKRLTPEDFTPLEYAPAWSPDGRTVAFVSVDASNAGQLWKVPASGGEPQPLAPAPGEYLNPVWSPDGASLVAVRGAGVTARGRPLIAEAIYTLVRIPAAGGEPEPLAEIHSAIWNADNVERLQTPRPSFGPRGRIFFTELVDRPDQEDKEEEAPPISQLVSVAPDGSDRHVHLRFPFADDAAPSPDGRFVAFQEGDNVYLAPFRRPRRVPDAPLLDRRDPAARIRALSTTGGLLPRWHGARSVEFGSGDRYFRYDIDTEKTQSQRLVLRVPRDVPAGSLRLKGARIIPLDGAAVIERGDVVVEGARIRCVGACDGWAADRVVDITGKVIIPGFVDMHAHRHAAHRGFDPIRDFEAAAYLAYGVTTTLEPSAWSQNVFPLAELIDAGRVVGPRSFSTGDPLFRGDWQRSNRIDSYADAEHEILRLKSWGAVSIKQYLQQRRDQRQWIADVVRAKQLMLTGEGGSLIYDIGMILDGQTGWEHPLPQVPIYADVARFFGAAHAVYSATLVVGGPAVWNEEYFYQQRDVWKDAKLRRFLPWRQLVPQTRRRWLRPVTDYSFPLLAQGLADILAAGGGGAIGSHGQLHGLASHWEVWMAASALGPLGALELASMQGARFLGADRDLGSIAVGKLADLMVLRADPLQDIRNTANIALVMKGGVLYDADTLDELWPRERAYGNPPWQNERIYVSDDRPTDTWDRAH